MVVGVESLYSGYMQVQGNPCLIDVSSWYCTPAALLGWWGLWDSVGLKGCGDTGSVGPQGTMQTFSGWALKMAKWHHATAGCSGLGGCVGPSVGSFSGAMPLCGILANPYASLRACEEQEALLWLGFQVHAESMVEM